MTSTALAFIDVPDPGPMARLLDVKADSSAPKIIFLRLCEGETLNDIRKAWGLPKGPFFEWFTTEHSALYDAALRVRADDLAHDALAVADAADADTVAPAKLQVDTRLKLAAKWDRARYGERDAGVAGGGVTVVIDRSCNGTVSVQAQGATLTVAGGVSAPRVVSGTEPPAGTADGKTQELI